MINIIKYAVISVLLLSIIKLPSFADVKITPNKFEFKVEKNERKKFITGAFTVASGDKEVIRFKVYPNFFNISNTGTMSLDDKNSQYSMVKNIRFAPNEFTIMPEHPQIVRFTLTNINALPEGESRLVLFLEDTKTKEVILKSENTNINPMLVVKTRVAIPIYLDKGSFIKNGEIEDLAINTANDKLVYIANVKSTGNSKIRVNGLGQIIDGKKLISEFRIENRAIQANTVSKITNYIPVNKLELDKKYKLKIILSYEDQKSKNRKITKDAYFNTPKNIKANEQI